MKYPKSIPRFITISKVIQKYGIPEGDLLELVNSNKITISDSGKEILVDENGLKKYLELKTIYSRQNEYLKKIIAEKKEEINAIIARYDDRIFLLKSSVEFPTLFLAFIHELATFINNSVQREIFIKVSQGNNIYDIAQEHRLTYDQVCYQYSLTIKKILRQTGFIYKYRQTLTQQALKIRNLEIENRSLKSTLYKFELSSSLQKEEICLPEEITPDIAEILSLKLGEDIILPTRVFNCLNQFGLITVEDLLRVIKATGLNGLKRISHFGTKSLCELRAILIEYNLLKDDCSSDLFKYL